MGAGSLDQGSIGRDAEFRDEQITPPSRLQGLCGSGKATVHPCFPNENIRYKIIFHCPFPSLWPLMLEFKKKSSFGELNVKSG